MAGATPRAKEVAMMRKSGRSGFQLSHHSLIGISINVDGTSLPDMTGYKKGAGVDGTMSSMTPGWSRFCRWPVSTPRRSVRGMD